MRFRPIFWLGNWRQGRVGGKGELDMGEGGKGGRRGGGRMVSALFVVTSE